MHACCYTLSVAGLVCAAIMTHDCSPHSSRETRRVGKPSRRALGWHAPCEGRAGRRAGAHAASFGLGDEHQTCRARISRTTLALTITPRLTQLHSHLTPSCPFSTDRLPVRQGLASARVRRLIRCVSEPERGTSSPPKPQPLAWATSPVALTWPQSHTRRWAQGSRCGLLSEWLICGSRRAGRPRLDRLQPLVSDKLGLGTGQWIHIPSVCLDWLP